MAGKTLGTAWIQIKPTMKGMTSSIRSELSGVGESEGQTVGSKFSNGFAAKVGAVSAITERVFSGAISTISGQISDAVTRADTLNRFPKVMEMMGYSAEDAAKSIEKLRNGVKGIPTSLADVVSGTQRLAALTGDVDKAADWALALSDAMLITTGDVNEASRGMEQFMQLLARGKPSGNDWNTIMEVASPIMNELARSLGYAGAELGGDFYTALQDGTLSTQQMMEALVNLDKNGGGGLESLHKRVETSTGGINATITNLRQSISNAIVDIIQSIGSENIEGIITNIKEVLLNLVGVIKNVMLFLKDNWSWLQYVAGAIAAFFAGATVIKGILKVKNTIQGLGKTLSSIFGKAAQNTVTKNAEKTFSGIGTGIKNALGTVKDILTGVVNTVMEPIKALFKGVGEAIAGFFKALADPAIALGALMFATAAASIAAAIVLIGGALGLVTPAISAFFNEVLMPLGDWLLNTLLTIVNSLTDAIIRLTNEAVIPLGAFFTESFVIILQTVSDTIINLTQNALIPLINTLSGTFTTVMNTVANILNSVIKTALEGVATIIVSVGEGFEHMGNAIKTALEGVQGVLQTFADLIKSIAEAAVAIVAMVTGHSINYGHGYAHLFADGGKVEGPGTATSDSIPAFLSDGEYVIRASAAHKIGYDNLDSLNETGSVGLGQTNYFTINGYNKSPEELANIISRKIAFNQRGVLG